MIKQQITFHTLLESKFFSFEINTAIFFIDDTIQYILIKDICSFCTLAQ